MVNKYIKILKESWNSFNKNYVLLMPPLIRILLMFGFLIIIAIEILLVVLAGLILNAELGVFSLFVLLPIILFSLIDFVLMLSIDSYVNSMKIGMCYDIVRKGKTSSEKMFAHGKKYFMKYLNFNLIKIALLIIPLSLLALIVSASFMLNPLFGLTMLATSIICFIIYSVALGMVLLFVEPVLVSERKSVWIIVKNSFKYTAENFGHVFYTWGTIILAIICLNAVIAIFQITTVFFLYFFVILTGILARISLDIILDLFRFKSWFKLRMRRFRF